MLVRPAIPDDAEAACAVLRRSIAELCEADHRGDKTLLDRWLANKTPETVAGWIAASHTFVAELDGRLAGVAAVTRSGRITLNYVAPDARFRGVSKALVSALESTAAAMGCAACRLESTRTAERFYKSLGYVEESG